MTKAVYLIDSGVKPWGSLDAVENNFYRTLTVVTLSQKGMATILFSVFSILGSLFSKMFRWHTIERPFSGNKVQFIRMNKALSQDLPGYKNTYLAESSIAGVWCNTAELELPFKNTHLDYLCGGRSTVLALISNVVRSSMDAWDILSKNAGGYDCDAIYQVVEKHNSIVLARFYEEETHMAFQLFGTSKSIEDIEMRLAPIGMTAMKERDEIVDFINAA